MESDFKQEIIFCLSLTTYSLFILIPVFLKQTKQNKKLFFQDALYETTLYSYKKSNFKKRF